MRRSVLLSMLALLVGAAPALAQVGTASSSPYPTDYPVETTTKHKTPRKALAPKTASVPQAAKQTKQITSPYPTGYPFESAAKKPSRARAARKPEPMSPQAAKPKQAATKAAPEKAKTARNEPANAKAETPKPEATKPAADAASALASISAGDRLKIEQALYWSGDYSSAVTGEDRMQAAIKSFQKRNKAKITGELTNEQRAELVAAADRHVQEYGWRVVVDPATGIRIGLPAKLVPMVHDAAQGTRWSSPHGEVQVETFRVTNSNLAALFEREKKEPKTRTIEHSTLNDDGFFISGMQGLKYFSVRAKQRDGEVRGFTLLYDQMMEGIVAPAVVAMASAFSPFPERALPFAALTKKVEYGTGLIVGANGYILTPARLAQNCNVIVADGLGNAERVSVDENGDVALLRVYGTGKLPALMLTGDAAKPGEVTLIGIPDPKEQDGAKKLSEIRAKLSDGNAIELPRPVPVAGFSGAAALDGKGQFIGMMETRNFVLASTEPGIPPVRLVTAATIRDFLARNQVASSGGTADARKATVRIICVRQ